MASDRDAGSALALLLEPRLMERLIAERGAEAEAGAKGVARRDRRGRRGGGATGGGAAREGVREEGEAAIETPNARRCGHGHGHGRRFRDRRRDEFHRGRRDGGRRDDGGGALSGRVVGRRVRFFGDGFRRRPRGRYDARPEEAARGGRAREAAEGAEALRRREALALEAASERRSARRGSLRGGEAGGGRRNGRRRRRRLR